MGEKGTRGQLAMAISSRKPQPWSCALTAAAVSAPGTSASGRPSSAGRAPSSGAKWPLRLFLSSGSRDVEVGAWLLRAAAAVTIPHHIRAQSSVLGPVA